MLTVKEVFHLTNRGVEGFMRSLFAMLKMALPVPDHTTLSKRGKDLKVNLPKKSKQHLDIVMDSTGLKIYGEGEWKVRQHGVSKRRTWLKLHVGANPEDGEIQAALLTDNSVSDDEAVEALLAQIEQEIGEFAADGAYDKRKVYASLNAHSPDVRILIPPRKNARIWQHGNTQAERLKRDENSQAWTKKMEAGIWRSRSFIVRNSHVPFENHLRRRTLGTPDGYTNDAGINSLCGAQQNDAPGHAASLQGRITARV
jgi:hypothetical protein